MIEVRLMELMIKGDRLDEINAEEVLNRRAATQARINALRQGIHHLSQRWAAWITASYTGTATPLRKITQG